MVFRLFALLFLLMLLPQTAFATAITLDGSAVNNASPVSLTTTKTNDEIFLYIAYSTATSPSVSDTARLTWTKRSTATNSTLSIDVWYAFSAAALTSDSIAFSGYTFPYATNPRPVAFGINYANTSSPYDNNGSLPASAGYALSTTCVVSGISTSNANDMLLGVVLTNASGVAAPTGFTSINGNSIFNVSYKIVSSTQSSLSSSFSTAATPPLNVCGIDAVKQASSATNPFLLGVP